MRITVYDFGKIIVDGKTHTRDVIIYPERVEGSWWQKEGHRLDIDRDRGGSFSFSIAI